MTNLKLAGEEKALETFNKLSVPDRKPSSERKIDLIKNRISGDTNLSLFVQEQTQEIIERLFELHGLKLSCPNLVQEKIKLECVIRMGIGQLARVSEEIAQDLKQVLIVGADG